MNNPIRFLLAFCLSVPVFSFVAALLFMDGKVMDDHWFMKQWPTILGALISGGMTVFAGYLAFKEARENNSILRRQIRMNNDITTIEYLKAIIEKTDEKYRRMFPNAEKTEIPNGKVFSDKPTANQIDNNFVNYVTYYYDAVIAYFKEADGNSRIMTPFTNNFLEHIKELQHIHVDATNNRSQIYLEELVKKHSIFCKDTYAEIHKVQGSVKPLLEKLEARVRADAKILNRMD